MTFTGPAAQQAAGMNLFGQSQWARRGEGSDRVSSLEKSRTTDETNIAAVTTAVGVLQTADLVVPHITGLGGNIASGGASWVSGQRLLLIVASTVITFAGGNSNITFTAAFPHGLASVVASNGDGPAGVILNTTNYSLSACGISAINADSSLFGGGLRVNYTALGW